MFNVIIRTNSFTTNVEVDTEGSVKHFDKAGKLSIKKVAMSSFHEFGNVRTVELTKGNFVIESTGNVTLVSVVATTAGDVKLDIQGKLDVVAGDSSMYEVTAGQADQTVNAPIEDNTYAIVNGVAKTDIQEEYFADGNKVVLLKDYTGSAITLGSCEVVGNLTKLSAIASGDKVIVLKNIHTTNIKLKTESVDYKFDGSLTFDGGLLETSNPGTSDSNAAIYAQKGTGKYTFKNMTVSSNITKGIKISAARSVTVENCDFDASKLNCITSGIDSDMRSLSLIDIQEGNTRRGDGQQMSVKISGNRFVAAPQGKLSAGTADSDTAAAIKIKAEDVGFSSVEISNNEFIDCYRDVAAGVNVMTDNSSAGFNAQKCPALLKSELNNANKWTIANNTSNGSAERGILLVCDGNPASHSFADKLGQKIGGCTVYNTYNTTKLTASSTKADANALMEL